MPSKSGTLYREEHQFLDLTRGRENALSIDQEGSKLRAPQSISFLEGERKVTITGDEVLAKNYDNALRRERPADKMEELEGILSIGLGRHEVVFLSKLGEMRDRFTSLSGKAVSRLKGKKTIEVVTEDKVLDALNWLVEIRGRGTPMGIELRLDGHFATDDFTGPNGMRGYYSPK